MEHYGAILAHVLARRRVRLIVVQPTVHNPTGTTLSHARRERLVALARRPTLTNNSTSIRKGIDTWYEKQSPQIRSRHQ